MTTAIAFHFNDRKAIFDREGLTAHQKWMEAVNYGIRRIGEINLLTLRSF